MSASPYRKRKISGRTAYEHRVIVERQIGRALRRDEQVHHKDEQKKNNAIENLARPLADRHYNRQKIGAPQFVPPGRCVVLLTEQATALWVTSWAGFVGTTPATTEGGLVAVQMVPASMPAADPPIGFQTEAA